MSTRHLENSLEGLIELSGKARQCNYTICRVHQHNTRRDKKKTNMKNDTYECVREEEKEKYNVNTDKLENFKPICKNFFSHLCTH